MALDRQEMAVGIALDESHAMVTCYTPAMKSPQTIRSDGEDGDDGYSMTMPGDVWKAARGMGEPIEKIRDFLGRCLDRAAHDVDRRSLRVMVTVPRLEKLLGERLSTALEMLGLDRRCIYMQDYLCSFFYYTVNERHEQRGSDTALFEYDQETMIGYVLHIDRTKSPALASVRCAARQSVGSQQRDDRDDRSWDKERDRLLFELAKKVFEGRRVSTVFLMGDYYSRDWAEKSFQYLCGGRHAYQGHNLYTKGACYAAMERCGMIHMPDILFMGEDIVKDNLGMTMRVRGRSVYYPLVTAGVNWYEAHHECEFISDGEHSIDIVSKNMTGGDEVHHILRLDHLPPRPPRTTRLRMDLYFTSPSSCVVEVEDLGFGLMQRSSGRIWKRTIRL